MTKNKKILVEDTEISVFLSETANDDYISLSDMAHYRDTNRTDYIIQNWLRNRNTIEYLGVWEQLNNPNFNSIEFDGIRNKSGLNSFILTPKKWAERTNAIGIRTKAGRYGGTYAHKDIAFNFGMWLSPIFQLYIVKEYQRLKEQENNPLLQHWDVKRLLSKVNYHVHTDAIKDYVIPKLSISQKKEHIIYAKEADLLNLALFGYTAKEWEEANPNLAKKINMRDTASINQLIVLSNMEAFNSEMIKMNVPKSDRFAALHKMAKEQLASLNKHKAEFKFRKLSSDGNNTLLLE